MDDGYYSRKVNTTKQLLDISPFNLEISQVMEITDTSWQLIF